MTSLKTVSNIVKISAWHYRNNYRLKVLILRSSGKQIRSSRPQGDNENMCRTDKKKQNEKKYLAANFIRALKKLL